MALDLCAIKAVEQGYTQIELDDVKAAFRQEMDEHKETRRVLKETTEHLNEKTSKYEALQQHYIEQVALDNAEEYAAFMYYGLATAEAKRLEEDLLDSLKRYERARLTIDRVEMEAAEEFSNGLEGNGKRGRSRGRSRGSSRKSSRKSSKKGRSKSGKSKSKKGKGGKSKKGKKGGGTKSAAKKARGKKGGGKKKK